MCSPVPFIFFFSMLRRPPISPLFPYSILFFFFFNDTATTEIYTLSLHDALPISRSRAPPCCSGRARTRGWRPLQQDRKSTRLNSSHDQISYAVFCLKKKEHTSELQSRSDLVCRLLLEKKKANTHDTYS